MKERPLPNATVLRERLSYDPGTGLLTWKVGKFKSKWKGVTRTPYGTYTARIGVTDDIGVFKRHCLGTFKDEREAAEAYMFAALELHGDFARLQ